jgi:hypothetical protein
MAPAFQSTGQALRFVLLLLGLLMLPTVLALGRLPSRDQVYDGVPLSNGPFPFISQQVFREGADIDVLVVADSVLWVGLDAPYLQHTLSATLGRPAKVLVLAANWPGMDLRYSLLRDILARRRVGMVVLSPPRPGSEGDRPHMQAFRWLRFREDQSLSEGLSLKSRVSVYAAEVLGAPRQALNLVRPNLVYDLDRVSGGLGSKKVDEGYRGAAFERVQPTNAFVLPAEEMIRSPRSAGTFRITGPELNPYQLHFMHLIGELLSARQVPLVVLHVPLAKERGSAVVSQQAEWTEAFGVPATVIGVPSGVLFDDISDVQFYRYYYDDHLNHNGSELFTHAVAPAITRTYLAQRRHD